MRYYKLLLVITVLAVSSCSVNTRTAKSNQADAAAKENKDISNEKALIAEMKIKDTIRIGGPVQLKFTVYNYADSVQHFCKWHTPFEPLLSNYLEVKDSDGEVATYLGAMAKRIMPPPENSYIGVKLKDSVYSTVDLLKAYAIKKPSRYTITYVGQNMSGLVVRESVSFSYVK